MSLTKSIERSIRRIEIVLSRHYTPDSTSSLEVGTFSQDRIYLADIRTLIDAAKRVQELEKALRTVRACGAPDCMQCRGVIRRALPSRGKRR